MPETSSWEQKATQISENIQQHHTPFQIHLDPRYDSAEGTTLCSYSRAGDSALWTGHYLAAEAFRYGVSMAPRALTNLQRTLRGTAFAGRGDRNQPPGALLVPRGLGICRARHQGGMPSRDL
jgi:hypothetical protein